MRLRQDSLKLNLGNSLIGFKILNFLLTVDMLLLELMEDQLFLISSKLKMESLAIRRL